MFPGEVLRKFGGGRRGLKLIADHTLVPTRSPSVPTKAASFEIRVKCIVEACMTLPLATTNTCIASLQVYKNSPPYPLRYVAQLEAYQLFHCGS